jgi:hypothetical protein
MVGSSAMATVPRHSTSHPSTTAPQHHFLHSIDFICGGEPIARRKGCRKGVEITPSPLPWLCQHSAYPLYRSGHRFCTKTMRHTSWSSSYELHSMCSGVEITSSARSYVDCCVIIIFSMYFLHPEATGKYRLTYTGVSFRKVANTGMTYPGS